MKDIQLPHLFDAFQTLQYIHGDKKLCPVYGAWCTKHPKLFLLFMNPTGKNISCTKNWKWLRAPRLGTKNIWKLLASLWVVSKTTFDHIQKLKANEWTEEFSLEVYKEITSNGVYISNLAKCTQADARPLKDKVFKEYLDLIHEEIAYIKPQSIITFGNQVSSILLNKKITVSEYKKDEHENLNIEKKNYKVYPSFYPVGQGMRNLPKAIARVQYILNSIPPCGTSLRLNSKF